MMYCKNGEKSRCFFLNFFLKSPRRRFGGRIFSADPFLFFTALALFAGFLVLNFAFRGVGVIKRTRLVLSRQWEEQFGGDLVDSLIREFGERNPELLILRELSAKNGARAAAVPDILLFDESEYEDLAGKGALAPLNGYAHFENGIDRRALPLISFMDLLFYNINLLKAAGFDRPPKNRAEFLAYAKAVSAAPGGSTGLKGVYGTGLALSPEDPLSIRREIFSQIWASGSSLFQDGKPYFGGRAATETLDFLGRLKQDGVIAPDAFDKTGAGLAADFAEGRIAMMIASSREIPELRKRMGDSAFGITIIPGMAETPGQNRISLLSWYAGIGADCTGIDEARTFLAFLAEKGSSLAARMEAVPGNLPRDNIIPHAESFPGPYIRNDPFYSKAWEIYEAAKPVEEFSGMPEAAEYEQIVREELARFFADRQKAADTAAAIQKRWAS
ncbi:MAG: extracellular solute-binding protein, partial [Treponema sp.]|nr:extracellular solute-binding protein [Treponema sp.]